MDGAAGRLAATEATVTRFRTGLEGSRDYTLAGRLSLRPSVEVGLRHDGGDAENGAGMDVGGGLVVSDSSTGLAIDVRVRMLVMHQAEGFRERGMALSLSYNPTPSTPLGFVAQVAPSWGGQATSGAEALWGQETMAGMARGGVADGTRLDAEVGYGLAVGSRFVGTPRVGVGTSEYGQDYRLGYSLGALGGEGTHLPHVPAAVDEASLPEPQPRRSPPASARTSAVEHRGPGHALRRGTGPPGHAGLLFFAYFFAYPRTIRSTASNGWTASSGSGRTTRPSRSSTSIRNGTAHSM